MIVTSTLAARSNRIEGNGFQLPSRAFSYDHGKIKKLELQVSRKIQLLRMFNDLMDFDNEPPQIQYDKKTGDIKIIEGRQAVTTG
jgi:hypothetical protein